MKYQPPFDPSLAAPVNGVHNTYVDASYVNGDPVTGNEGSIPPAEAFEHPQREIMEVIERAGIVPDHEDLTQLWQALQWLVGERLVESVGGGVPIYGGLLDEAHVIRSLEAGANITIDVVESPVGSGQHRLRISSTAAAVSGGGGGGGGGTTVVATNIPLLNVGDGTGTVYKGFVSPNDEIRSLKGLNGIAVRNNGNVIEIDGAAITQKVRTPFNQRTLVHTTKTVFNISSDYSIWPAASYTKLSNASDVRVSGVISAAISAVASSTVNYGYGVLLVKLGNQSLVQACQLSSPSNSALVNGVPFEFLFSGLPAGTHSLEVRILGGGAVMFGSPPQLTINPDAIVQTGGTYVTAASRSTLTLHEVE